jgi:hypothetical protein
LSARRFTTLQPVSRRRRLYRRAARATTIDLRPWAHPLESGKRRLLSLTRKRQY